MRTSLNGRYNRELEREISRERERGRWRESGKGKNGAWRDCPKRDGSCVPLRSNDNVVLAYFMIKL